MRFVPTVATAMATAASIAGCATPADAGYYVSTSANTGRSYNRGCAATYNANGDTGAKFIINDGSRANCIAGGGPGTTSFNNQTVGVSGTTDTTGTLTAAHDESSVTSPPDGAYASASADLATGQVHLLATAANFSESSAQAHLSDTLHFTIAGAGADTVTLIPVSFSFDGKMPGTSDPQTAFAELNYGFYFGNASAYEFGDYGAGYYGVNGTYPTFTYASPARVSGWQSYSFASYDPLNTQFTGIYAITGATADIAIDFDLGLRATRVALDYSNTGRIGIGNVAGVSYTSDSGVFLTANAVTTGAVPETSTWMLMIAGFGMVGAACRLRPSGIARFA